MRRDRAPRTIFLLVQAAFTKFVQIFGWQEPKILSIGVASSMEPVLVTEEHVVQNSNSQGTNKI